MRAKRQLNLWWSAAIGLLALFTGILFQSWLVFILVAIGLGWFALSQGAIRKT